TTSRLKSTKTICRLFIAKSIQRLIPGTPTSLPPAWCRMSALLTADKGAVGHQLAGGLHILVHGAVAAQEIDVFAQGREGLGDALAGAEFVGVGQGPHQLRDFLAEHGMGLAAFAWC